jgi:uncharacterized protein (TIGR00297 family)
MAPSSEVGRQLVHIGAGAFALLFRWLVWWQAALLAAAAAAVNLVILPRMASRLYRPEDLGTPWTSGIALYPIAVLGLVVCFPTRLDIAAAAWGILAAGDGFATLVGVHVRSRRLPWNRAKSVAGLIAFVVCGTLAATALAAWTTNASGRVPTWWLLIAPLTAAVIAGLVETVPIRLNDNLSVPAVAAMVLWSLSLLDESAWRASLPELTGRIIPAVAVNGLAALGGWRAHTVTAAGAVVGAVIGVAVFIGTGWAGWTMLVATFLTAALATRAGFRRKSAAGIEEDRGGRRGPGNAIANTGVAAWAALLSAGMPDAPVARLAMAAALATSASDTVASEVGKAWGKTTWLVTGFRRVPPGTSGAVSLEGTLAGIVCAALLAGLAVWLALVPARWLVMIVAAATIASFVESVLGATLERPGILDNNALNFVNSVLGAGLAVAAAAMLG